MLEEEWMAIHLSYKEVSEARILFLASLGIRAPARFNIVLRVRYRKFR
jgi:hypothetical protein